MPIESAPRGDGDEFIGWDGEIWDKTWKGWIENGRVIYVRADYRVWNPTHWKPRPEPPEVQK
jgi:hypothetical protein